MSWIDLERKEGVTGATALAVAAIALGYAVQLSNGNLHPEAIRYLTLALGLLLLAATSVRVPRLEALGDGPLVAVIGTGLAFQIGQLLTTSPGIYLRLPGPAALLPFYFGLAVAAVLCGAGMGQRPWAPRLRIPLLLATYFFLGAWMLRASPAPHIDVFVFQRDSAAALLAGQNPYALTFPDIYGNSQFYGPGVSVNGRLTFGFPYMPLSLLLVVPGHLLAGDYRYAQLAAMALSGGLMAYARPGRIGPLAAALFLFTPRALFVLEQGWTEPLAVLLLAATVFAACRIPRLVPWMFGLLLAIKQYLIFAVPLAYLLWPRPLPDRRGLARWAGRAVGIAAAVSLPLALWDVRAFWHDVVALQFLQPFRVEALSYLAWFARDGSARLPTGLAFLAACAGVALALWRAPRTPGGFATAMALTYAAFFAFNKQAFCNYYYFVIGTLCCAVAANPMDAAGGDVERPPGSAEPSSTPG